MLTLNNTELAFLAMLGHKELTETALRLYANKTYLFTPMFCPHLNVMWNAYIQLLKQYKKTKGLVLDRDFVAANLSEVVEADEHLPEELKDKCDAVLVKLVDGAIPPLDVGRRLLSNLVKLDANRNLMSKLNANADLLTLQQSLDASKRVLSAIEPEEQQAQDTGLVFSPFKDIEKLVTKSVRFPTGINWLDEVSSGGGRAGEMWLILGPSGGGKSTMAVQYACAQSMLGNNTLWVTYEQSLYGDLSERMIANITDTSLDVIRDVGFANLPQNVKDRFWSSVAGVDDRLIAMDMTKMQPDPQDPDDYGGIMSIWKQFRKLKEEGHAPKTVILDWFGSMMSRIASNKSLDLSACYRFKAQEEINNAIQFVRQEQILLLVFHQLDVKAAGARPTYLADATHAQDMHNLQNFFDLVFTIGVRDTHNVCYFSSPKARKGNRVTRTLKLIGDKARFVKEDGWLPNRDGNFYKPGEGDGGTQDFGEVAASFSREIE